MPVRKIEKDFVGEVLREQERALLTARWTQIEALAAERPEVVVSAGGIGASDPRHSEAVVAASEEPLADVADPVQTEHAVGSCILLVVDVAELVEVTFKDRV